MLQHWCPVFSMKMKIFTMVSFCEDIYLRNCEQLVIMWSAISLCCICQGYPKQILFCREEKVLVIVKNCRGLCCIVNPLILFLGLYHLRYPMLKNGFKTSRPNSHCW